MMQGGINYLGLCQKAGKLAYGLRQTIELLKKDGVALIVITQNVSAKTKKEAEYHAAKNKVRTIELKATMDEVLQATGKRAGVIAVLDINLAKLIMNAER